MKIELEKVSHAFGPLSILEDFSAVFPSLEVTVLLGPSGCGKTTLLNILAGLIIPRSGSVQIEGNPCTELKVGYMFQDIRLVPWLTVQKNLELVLPSSLPREEKRKRVEKILQLVELSQASELYPSELSGGMSRRAGMARAYLFEPEVYLMDESFQGLDPPLKFQLLRTFLHLRSVDPRTTLFVTHDIEEALLVGDEIHVLSPAPTRIRYSVRNPVPAEKRYPGHPEFSPLERDLFAVLSGESFPNTTIPVV